MEGNDKTRQNRESRENRLKGVKGVLYVSSTACITRRPSRGCLRTANGDDSDLWRDWLDGPRGIQPLQDTTAYSGGLFKRIRARQHGIYQRMICQITSQ